MTNKNEGPAKELVITRVLNAPRELVFKVWSEPAHMANWWGPAGFKLSIKKFDFRPGGIFHYHMLAGENQMWARFLFGDIRQNELITFTSSFSDPGGNVTPAPFSKDFPEEVFNRVTFTEENGKTLLTLRGGPVNPKPAQQAFYDSMEDSMRGGFGATFDQLEAYLATL